MAKSHIRITDQKGTQQRGTRPPQPRALANDCWRNCPSRSDG